MKKNLIFLVSAFLTLLFWQWAYFNLYSYYSGFREAKEEVSRLKYQVAVNEANTNLVQYKFDLFRQDIAKLLPNEFSPVKSKNLMPGSGFKTVPTSVQRGLASLVQEVNPEFLELAQVATSIDDLRDLFEKRKFKDVIRKGNRLLSLHPMSTDLVSIYFMISESYFQVNELPFCLKKAQEMIQLFPDDEKTGYVLLRVGLLFKQKNRKEEAQNTFQLVLHAFPKQENLKAQAEKLISDLSVIE